MGTSSDSTPILLWLVFPVVNINSALALYFALPLASQSNLMLALALCVTEVLDLALCTMEVLDLAVNQRLALDADEHLYHAWKNSVVKVAEQPQMEINCAPV